MNSRIVEAGMAKNIEPSFKNMLWKVAQQASRRYYQPLSLTTPRQQQQFTLRTYNSLLYRAGTNQIGMNTDATVLRNVANKDAKAAYNASILKAQQTAQAQQAQAKQQPQTQQPQEPKTQSQPKQAQSTTQRTTQTQRPQQKGTEIGDGNIKNIEKRDIINMNDLEAIKQDLGKSSAGNLMGRLSRLNKGLKNSIADLRILDNPAIGKKVYKLPAHLMLTIKTEIPVPVKNKQQAQPSTQQTLQPNTNEVKESRITKEDHALLEAYKYKEELHKYEELFGKKVDPASYIISKEGRDAIKKVIEEAFENSLMNYKQTTLTSKVGGIKIMDARGTEIKDPGEDEELDEELEGGMVIEAPIELEETKPKLGNRILHGIGTVLKVLSAGK